MSSGDGQDASAQHNQSRSVVTAATFLAVLPALDYDLATSCVESMSWTFSRNLLLLDNSDSQTIAEWASPRAEVGWVERTVERPANRGVSRSWNMGAERVIAGGLDYLVIVSQSVLFGAAKGDDFLDELNDRNPAYVVHASDGWKLLAIHRTVLERVGLFDEVFSPGYFEDTDYLIRLARAGFPSPRENGRTLDQVVVDVSSRGDALMLKSGQVRLDYAGQEAKYIRKWGGFQGEEKFTHPYNLPELDWSYVGAPPSGAVG